MGTGLSTEAEQPPDYQQAPDGGPPSPEGLLPSALVVCGPSGVGKGTLINKLRQQSDRFGFSCSHTSRPPRPGEEDGKHYWFINREDFEDAISKNKFLEYAYVHSNIYGTSYKAVQDVAATGRCCVLDIDVQGARLVRQSGLRAIFVFIAPPNIEELEKRLRGRGTETEEQIQVRLRTAQEELNSMNEMGLYDYVIFNDKLEEALQQLLIVAQRALDGHVGNGTGQGPVTLVPEDLVNHHAPQGAMDYHGEAEAGSIPEEHPSHALPPSSLGVLPPAGVYRGEAETSRQHASPSQPLADNVVPHGIERWRGKVALVTGASSGIGWSICEALALAGLRVVAVARRRERLELLQQVLVDKRVPIADFLPVVCDITKEAEVVALPRIIVKRWPEAGVDVLVNNAGLGRNNAHLLDGSTASWVEMISTNVLGLCMCSREAVQDMKRRGSFGHIINISSMSGHRVAFGGTGGGFYAATKHAVRALSEGLRQEARENKLPLRVSCISPGLVETEFARVSHFGNADAARKSYGSFAPLKADDVAQAVVWCLAAPDHVDINDVLMRPIEQPF
eukprot:jgi/Botrbrau1/921/Bobra.0167s0034.1